VDARGLGADEQLGADLAVRASGGDEVPSLARFGAFVRFGRSRRARGDLDRPAQRLTAFRCPGRSLPDRVMPSRSTARKLAVERSGRPRRGRLPHASADQPPHPWLVAWRAAPHRPASPRLPRSSRIGVPSPGERPLWSATRGRSRALTQQFAASRGELASGVTHVMTRHSSPTLGSTRGADRALASSDRPLSLLLTDRKRWRVGRRVGDDCHLFPAFPQDPLVRSGVASLTQDGAPSEGRS
jgi:hypothetical protein